MKKEWLTLIIFHSSHFHHSNQSFFSPTCSKLIWNMAYEDTALSLCFPILAKEDLHLITEREFSSVVNCCPLEALLLPFVWFCNIFVYLVLLRRPHSAFDSVFVFWFVLNLVDLVASCHLCVWLTAKTLVSRSTLSSFRDPKKNYRKFMSMLLGHVKVSGLRTATLKCAQSVTHASALWVWVGSFASSLSCVETVTNTVFFSPCGNSRSRRKKKETAPAVYACNFTAKRHPESKKGWLEESSWFMKMFLTTQMLALLSLL